MQISSVENIINISHISSIYCVSVNVDTIYSSDSRSTEISEFFLQLSTIFRRYIGIFFLQLSTIFRLSVFYLFFGIFFDISVTVHGAGHCLWRSLMESNSIKYGARGVRTLPKTAGFQPPIH